MVVLLCVFGSRGSSMAVSWFVNSCLIGSIDMKWGLLLLCPPVGVLWFIIEWGGLLIGLIGNACGGWQRVPNDSWLND